MIQFWRMERDQQPRKTPLNSYEGGVKLPFDDVSEHTRAFLSPAIDNLLEYHFPDDDPAREEQIHLLGTYFWEPTNLTDLTRRYKSSSEAIAMYIYESMLDLWLYLPDDEKMKFSVDKVMRLKPGDSLLNQREQGIKTRILETARVSYGYQFFIDQFKGRLGISQNEEDFLISRDSGWRTIMGRGISKGAIDTPASDIYLKWLLTDKRFYLRALKNYFIAGAQEYELHHRRDFVSREPSHRESDEGYIYVIKAGGRYKIGKAKELKDRVKTHQTSSPYETELVVGVVVEDYTKVERELHDLFAEKRVKGEWFTLDETDIKTIREHLGDYLSPN